MAELHEKILEKEIERGPKELKVFDSMHYEAYKKTSENPVDLVMFKQVLRFIFERCWFYMFTEGWRYSPPERMGEVFVRESVSDRDYYIDWVETKRLGKHVRVYNDHTNGLAFFVTWLAHRAKFLHSRYYNFKAYRGQSDLPPKYVGTRGLNKWIRKCQADPYMEDFRGHIY